MNEIGVTGGQSDSYVCVSPFGAKIQEIPEKTTTTIKPMMRLQLEAQVSVVGRSESKGVGCTHSP